MKCPRWIKSIFKSEIWPVTVSLTATGGVKQATIDRCERTRVNINRALAKLAERVVANIYTLTADEGDSVTIPNSNPEGDPNNRIHVFGNWTNWLEQDFDGDTLAECLETAAIARRLHDNPPPATDESEEAI